MLHLNTIDIIRAWDDPECGAGMELTDTDCRQHGTHRRRTMISTLFMVLSLCLAATSVSQATEVAPREDDPDPVSVTIDKVIGPGAEEGKVVSFPKGIDCGSACTASFSYGTVVTLMANAPNGTAFSGWQGGGCTGTGTCTLVTDTSASDEIPDVSSVTATFDKLEEEISLPTVTVDLAINPLVAELPDEGMGTRPLASIVDGSGIQADFVENEMILSTSDAGVLDSFLDRWNGAVIYTLNPREFGLNGIDPLYLIQVDTSAADTSRISSDLRALDSLSRGEHLVSSERGQKLIAAAAQELRGGLLVGINWIVPATDIRDGFTTEAPDGDEGFTESNAYDADTFQWHHLNYGSIQNIGVTEAWRWLDLSDRIHNKVSIYILDMGFQPNDDFPEFSVIDLPPPFPSTIGTKNPLRDKTWHGTLAVMAGMGKPDNHFGAAGPAGPVGRAVISYSGIDLFLKSVSLLSYLVPRPRQIINMSFGVRIPAALAAVAAPLSDTLTALTRFQGHLIFASAGNNGENVDARECPIIGPCWEKAFHMPCESTGVTCVGGLASNSKLRHIESNYGSKDVDIYAPFSVLVGPDPDNTANRARTVSGTSFSSPYAAGVAALIWAANPSLSAREVERILLQTAHRGVGDASRYVNAFGAVQRALPPFISIMSPSDGLSLEEGQFMNLQAFIHPSNKTLRGITWTSDRDGQIGEGFATGTNALSLGTHRITARAAFSDGSSVEDSVNATITQIPPEPSVRIVKPSNGEQFQRADPITLVGESNLATDQVSWHVDGSAAPFAIGHNSSISGGTLSVGNHTITFKGTNGRETRETSVQISVQPPILACRKVLVQLDSLFVEKGEDLQEPGTHAEWRLTIEVDKQSRRWSGNVPESIGFRNDPRRIFNLNFPFEVSLIDQSSTFTIRVHGYEEDDWPNADDNLPTAQITHRLTDNWGIGNDTKVVAAHDSSFGYEIDYRISCSQPG